MEVQLRVGLAGVVRLMDGDCCAADEESGILPAVSSNDQAGAIRRGDGIAPVLFLNDGGED